MALMRSKRKATQSKWVCPAAQGDQHLHHLRLQDLLADPPEAGEEPGLSETSGGLRGRCPCAACKKLLHSTQTNTVCYALDLSCSRVCIYVCICILI